MAGKPGIDEHQAAIPAPYMAESFFDKEGFVVISTTEITDNLEKRGLQFHNGSGHRDLSESREF